MNTPGSFEPDWAITRPRSYPASREVSFTLGGGSKELRFNQYYDTPDWYAAFQVSLKSVPDWEPYQNYWDILEVMLIIFPDILTRGEEIAQDIARFSWKTSEFSDVQKLGLVLKHDFASDESDKVHPEKMSAEHACGSTWLWCLRRMLHLKKSHLNLSDAEKAIIIAWFHRGFSPNLKPWNV